MEGQPTTKVVDGESITDIQNYLASFNKEIQDGSGGGSTGGTNASTPVTAAAAATIVMSTAATIDDGTPVRTSTTTSASDQTYYITTASGGTAVSSSEFQTVVSYAVTPEQQQQFNGEGGAGEAATEATTTTFYPTAQYYATTSADGQPQFTAIQAAFPALESQTTTDGTTSKPARSSSNATTVAVVAATASSSEGQEANDAAEATEISVTMPVAGIVTEAGNSDVDEELLQSNEGDQSTYVAVQPVGKPVVLAGTGASGIAALLNNADGQTPTRKNAGRLRTIRMVVQQPDGTEQQQDVELASAGDSNEGAVVTQGTLQMISTNHQGGESGQHIVDGQQQQVLLNTGNQYQTVTIVPSETNQGEVSYVLIVSQPDDGNKGGGGGEKESEGDVDMSIYDFNDGEQPGVGTEDGDENEPTGKVVGATMGNNAEGVRDRPKATPKSARIAKSTPKKSQSVTQAHMCNYCNYTSPKRYLLSRHMKSHSEERPHKCSVCERGFKTLASLQNHVNTHTGTRPHQCKECDSAFTTSGELVRHVRYKHTHEKPHRCTDCDYASVELSKLKRHMRCHTGERPYQCPHCTYASPDTYKLKRHLRIHTGEKPYECDICRARFTQSNSLKAHKLIHTGNKPIFHCELCPTTCGRKTDLRIHVQKLHTSEKPLKCRRCGKSFPDRYTYKLHSKTHEGEKCFKCDLCPYASISQRHLESHMLIHTDQKPYQCEECEQSFRQKQLLKRHKNLYHNPDYVPPTPKEKTHECSGCMRAFRHKGNLIRHMAIHDPDATAQEKEAALLVHHRIKKKRINEDGVEEEYSEEEEAEDFDDVDGDDGDDDDDEGFDYVDDPNEISVGRQLTTADGQQVVVLEVIQLQGPEGEQQAVAVLSGESMSMMGGNVPEETTLMASNDNMSGMSLDTESMSQTDEANNTTAIMFESPRKIRRSLRPKMTLTGDVEIGDEFDAIQAQEDTAAVANISRGRGRRRNANDDADYTNVSPPGKRGRGRGRGRGRPPKLPRTSAATDEFAASDNAITSGFLDETDAETPNEEEIARREAEAAKRRQAQKQRDLDECFGFKDDDDDDDDEADSSAMEIMSSMHNDGGQ